MRAPHQEKGGADGRDPIYIYAENPLLISFESYDNFLLSLFVSKNT